jgi:hypothetical protein
MQDRPFGKSVEHTEEIVMAVIPMDSIHNGEIILNEWLRAQFVRSFFNEALGQSRSDLRMEL